MPKEKLVEQEEFLPKKKKKVSYLLMILGVLVLALLGAIGIGFQNFSAFLQVLLTSAAMSYMPALGLAVVTAGVCSTIVNFFLNAELLLDFYKRVTKKPLPVLSTAGKVQYALGILVFLITGILFGMTAFSVAGAGGLAALSSAEILAIVVGVFVSVITIFQELETWLRSFDNPLAVEIHIKLKKLEQDPTADVKQVMDKLLNKIQKLQKEQNPAVEEENNKQPKENPVLQTLLDENGKVQFKIMELALKFERKELNRAAVIAELKKLQAEAELTQSTFADNLKSWWKKFESNPIGYLIGLIISLGNVMALSLLFTIGLTTFLIFVGVPAFPALMAGFAVAFTAGAFTEFYFYQGFLTDFCAKIKSNWKAVFNGTPLKVGGGVAAIIANGAINGVLAYFGIEVLQKLLMTAGIISPALLPLAVVSAVFAGVASLLLGSDFWIRFPEVLGRLEKKFKKWAGVSEEKSSHQEDGLNSERKALLDDDEVKDKNIPMSVYHKTAERSGDNKAVILSEAKNLLQNA